MSTHVVKAKYVNSHYVNSEVYKVKGLSKRLYTIVQLIYSNMLLELFISGEYLQICRIVI